MKISTVGLETRTWFNIDTKGTLILNLLKNKNVSMKRTKLNINLISICVVYMQLQDKYSLTEAHLMTLVEIFICYTIDPLRH